MALKSVLETVDDLPEDIQKEYVKRGDVFVLDIEDFGKHPGAVKLKTTLDQLDTKKKTVETELATVKEKYSFVPEDFDAEKFSDLLKGKNPSADVETLKKTHTDAVKALQDKHAQELADRDGRIGQLTGHIENDRVERDLRNGLLEVGVDPDLLDGALAVVRPLAKTTKADDGAITGVVIDTELGEIGVDDFAKDWANGKGKAYIGKAKGPGGNGNQQHTRNSPKGDFGGNKSDRVNAIASRFPDLPAR